MPEIQNPNLHTQGPGGSGGSGFSSTIALMTFVLLAILGYQYFVRPNPPATQQPAPVAGTQLPAPSAPAASSQPASAAPVHAAPTPVVAAAQETTTTIENEQYRIVFSNRGALVKHWYLKNYYDSGGKQGGRNLDLVQPETSKNFGYPLSFFTYEPALTSQLNESLYQVSVSGAQSSSSGVVPAPATLTFHYAANGLDVVKTLHFDSSYVISVDTHVTQNGAPVRALLQWPAGLGDMDEFQPAFRGVIFASTSSQFAWSLNGKSDSLKASKVSGNQTFDAPYSYAAVADLYFAAAFLPDDPSQATVVSLHHSLALPAPPGSTGSQQKRADVIGLAVGSTSGDTRVRLFAGPKATDILSSIHAIGPDGRADGPTLDSLLQFGFWSFLAKPLYLMLRFMVLHGIGNWGWAIIISTVVFNLTLLPTRITAMKSSLKMMRIQPKVDALKRKYAHLKATDPKRSEMNTEMMELYRAEGVNMYGSCLPMLVPMLLLWPYFRVLMYAVELRQAHWMWLTDLSQPDPTHVLPIFIIVTMFLTQYITPSPGMDPNQRKMMAIMMPVLFGFMLWHYASGLALYWVTGNIIMLAMQIAINRSHWGREMHEIAARRAAKKAGAKVIQGRR